MQFKLLALCSGLLLAAAPALAEQRNVYGLHEKALLPELGLELAAKLDTGAETASLSAQNIEIVRRDGRPWVRFELAVDGAASGKTLLRPLLRVGYIKRRAGDMAAGDGEAYTARPVIEMAVCMGQTLQKIEVNLTDRTAFDYPFLIGSSALKAFDALVDPARRYSAGSPSCA